MYFTPMAWDRNATRAAVPGQTLGFLYPCSGFTRRPPPADALMERKNKEMAEGGRSFSAPRGMPPAQAAPPRRPGAWHGSRAAARREDLGRLGFGKTTSVTGSRPPRDGVAEARRGSDFRDRMAVPSPEPCAAGRARPGHPSELWPPRSCCRSGGLEAAGVPPARAAGRSRPPVIRGAPRGPAGRGRREGEKAEAWREAGEWEERSRGARRGHGGRGEEPKRGTE